MSERLANEILASHWDGHLPVDVVAIAEELGAEVFEASGMGHLSGKIELTDEGACIYCRAGDPMVRKRFTIAHEIGHLALGHVAPGEVLNREDPPSNISAPGAPVEREANAFAAQLLMPRQALEFAVLQEGVAEIDRLARMFDVSQQAMTYRLQHIGLLATT